ncbi:MAG: RusA family crossover junction endodeoxyribonuclease [Oscillospiraceae bacterium]|nr:RusA family crossover junction endodeoxyribonuclease [Oscillospiraceae bacterium]
MRISFVIHGEPFGKERPRFCNKGLRVVTYTPEKTANYEKRVREEYSRKVGIKFKEKIPIEIKIKAFYGISKHTPKKWIEPMLEGKILPTKKPDVDNISKLICDALNGVCYHDDVQICKLQIEKFYSEEPHVEVEIKEMEVIEEDPYYN